MGTLTVLNIVAYTEDMVNVYHALRVIVFGIGTGLMLHHGVQPLFDDSLSPQFVNLVAILGGMAGILGALIQSRIAARVCMVAWILVVLHQMARKLTRDEDDDVEKTVYFVLIEGIYVLCVTDYIRLCQWYQASYRQQQQPQALDVCSEKVDLTMKGLLYAFRIRTCGYRPLPVLQATSSEFKDANNKPSSSISMIAEV